MGQEVERKNECLIVSGGEFAPLPETFRGAARVIACDRGYLYADSLGLVPDLIVGDFDSAPLPEDAPAVRRYPSRKDDTDTMIAVREALAGGYREIAICCALGGRLDHALANLQAASFAAAQGAVVTVLGGDTEIRVFSGGTEYFPRREGWSLSLLSLSDVCRGITIRGTEYDCRDLTLKNSLPVGVSNEWASGEAEVSLEEGILAVIESRIPV